ncbi:hypothetical protein T492DRAFT_874178 [Pavlovales sp. CCMP2436]|nr:hypothetical protein T492DRAFT_874178 [Pavlovales sp. CCMP2436]
MRLAPVRSLATSSQPSRVFDFTRLLDLLNRAVGGFVHVETHKKALKITFDDMGLYSKIDVKYDKESCVLTVMAEDGEGENKYEATRAITMPCHVIKPELIKAEALDGKIVVMIPAKAQAKKKKGENKHNIGVRLVGGEADKAIREKLEAEAVLAATRTLARRRQARGSRHTALPSTVNTSPCQLNLSVRPSA